MRTSSQSALKLANALQLEAVKQVLTSYKVTYSDVIVHWQVSFWLLQNSFSYSIVLTEIDLLPCQLFCCTERPTLSVILLYWETYPNDFVLVLTGAVGLPDTLHSITVQSRGTVRTMGGVQSFKTGNHVGILGRCHCLVQVCIRSWWDWKNNHHYIHFLEFLVTMETQHIENIQ